MPKERKRVNVIPVSRKGDRKSVLNYWSVSLMSMVSNIQEKIIRKQMGNGFLKRNYQNEGACDHVMYNKSFGLL